LSSRSPTGRLVSALVVLASIPIATTVSTGLQLATVVAVVVTMLLVDARRRVAGKSYELRAAG
jgi:hypothetical protein